MSYKSIFEMSESFALLALRDLCLEGSA